MTFAGMYSQCHALLQARSRRVPRVPIHIGTCAAGSMALAHLPALRAWPQDLLVTEHGVLLQTPVPQRNSVLARINAELRCQGLILAWRDELFDIVDPASGEHLCHTERAAARFWGTLTRGAHANRYLAGPDGRPTHLWIARRSSNKATDPGLFDNLIGGGVPQGQTPSETLVREGYEEAGLSPELCMKACAASVLRLHRDITEGLQLEDLHAFDLRLPTGLTPINQDGEVEDFACMPVAQALALASTEAMTVDAALVTLDFAIRHGLLTSAEDSDLQAAVATLQRGQSTWNCGL